MVSFDSSVLLEFEFLTSAADFTLELKFLVPDMQLIITY